MPFENTVQFTASTPCTWASFACTRAYFYKKSTFVKYALNWHVKSRRIFLGVFFPVDQSQGDFVITCKSSSAKHCVKDDHAFLWKHTICGYLYRTYYLPDTETPQPIIMKFCIIDYIGEMTWCANNGLNRWAGGGPTYGWNITSKGFFTIGKWSLVTRPDPHSWPER